MTPAIVSLFGVCCLDLTVIVNVPMLIYIQIENGALCNSLTASKSLREKWNHITDWDLWEKYWNIIYKKHTDRMYDYHHSSIYNGIRCNFHCSIAQYSFIKPISISDPLDILCRRTSIPACIVYEHSIWLPRIGRFVRWGQK